MSTLKKLFTGVWFAATHLRRKAYTAGLIVISGMAAVAIMFIGVKGFTGSTNITHVTTYEVEEEDVSEELETELVTEEVAAEESQSNFVPQTLTVYEALETYESAEAEEVLAKEPETDKNLKSVAEEDPAASLSVKDYTALVRIVEAEATDEDLKGKILIANVVLNRVNSKRFPDSIYEVVHQTLGGKAQFSPIDDGRYYTVSITATTENAVDLALSGTDYSSGALFFVAKSLASENAASWFDNNLEFIMTYGVHSFYKY